MICYQDEIFIEDSGCSMEEINNRIKELEIKNFGHEIDFDNLTSKKNEPTIFVGELGNIPISEYNRLKEQDKKA